MNQLKANVLFSCLGKPADLYDQTHPDWAPTKNMGHSSSSVSKPSSQSALARQKRAKERQNKKRKCVQELFKEIDCESEMNIIGEGDSEKENTDVKTSAGEETRSLECTSIAIQTDLSMQDIEELENLKQSQEAGNSVLSQSWFEADEERVKFYTGLTAMSVLMAVFDLISPPLPERKSISKFQQLLITLMRLRLNLSVQDLAYRFGVHASTVSRVFQTCMHVMYTSMAFLVKWPEREELKMTLPACFREKFSSCAVIIDCFEVFIDRPSCLLARAQTWSSYKHHNTAKFLIGITPQGTVSFISKGWGGRASDKFITEHCGVLNKLLPGDLVLADRGFDIEDSVGLYAARLQIPSFTKGKPQLSALDIETTRSLANVRIHVERVIGTIRQKYAILGHSVIPIHYLMSDGNESSLLDKIAVVCCALTNCCKSVIASD